IFNIEKHLYCFFIETKNISSRSFLKIISKSLLDSYIRVLLIFTDDWKTYYFTLPQYEKLEGKKKLKLSTLILDTSQIYRTDLEVISTLGIASGDASYRDIWRDCWQQAFNKERVNDQFFKDFEGVFFELRTLVTRQIEDVKLSHEFAQQTLNRLIFLYFIAKKEWLASDKKFISNFYKEYKIERNKGNLPQDSFYENWLKILFFEVFNKPYPNLGIARYIPADLKNNLVTFPYLNGGLFNEEDFDKVGANIPDSIFNNIFVFLDKYNFTIKEDSPLDIEVAVDPQMLGYLYESFANIAEEIYERNDLGVFYTPGSEVSFMVRRSLVEYFANHLEKIPKDLIYKFVFDEDKKEAIEYISKHNLWENLEFLIEDVKIVDPACGSGAFLLGSLKVLVELTQTIERHLGRERIDFDIKKDIIGKNFFGVDVMKWALHCAELRLWLSMIVEANLPEERRKEALLPNFNLRLRVGDSLVQKIGGISVDLKDLTISVEIKRKLNYLKEEKQKFYSNDPSRKFKDYEAVKREEIKIFQEILREEIINLDKKIQILNIQLSKRNQLNIYGEQSKEKVEKENVKKEMIFLEEKIELIKKACSKLEKEGKQFVIWEIDFADVFEEKHGFDIVIGNPPYINYKKISPPFVNKKELNLKEKTLEYKEDLVRSIKTRYPFVKEFNRKCDYYIYFYFHGLSLLNTKGTFCFITSNSWLDVDFGKDLQEFLVKYVPI
ncbi:MAG: Eco57I restriction-modification methylase domain-containing protein, partial [Actinobacteria bacterium]|nr:Eco57I restriction-modification methylase domain-containing protein [Actinomycetota bacterium]